jgi:hypothetical protein
MCVRVPFRLSACLPALFLPLGWSCRVATETSNRERKLGRQGTAERSRDVRVWLAQGLAVQGQGAGGGSIAGAGSTAEPCSRLRQPPAEEVEG